MAAGRTTVTVEALIGKGGYASIFRACINGDRRVAMRVTEGTVAHTTAVLDVLGHGVLGRLGADDTIWLSRSTFDATRVDGVDRKIVIKDPDGALRSGIKRFGEDTLMAKFVALADTDLHTILATGSHDMVARLRFVTGALTDLIALHDRGLVHGDIRADNVLVYSDRGYLSDFDMLAPHVPGGAPRVNQLEMTPPEAAKASTFAADIWALGMTCAAAVLGPDAIYRPLRAAARSRCPGSITAAREAIVKSLNELARDAKAVVPDRRERTAMTTLTELALGMTNANPAARMSYMDTLRAGLGRGAMRKSPPLWTAQSVSAAIDIDKYTTALGEMTERMRHAYEFRMLGGALACAQACTLEACGILSCYGSGSTGRPSVTQLAALLATLMTGTVPSTRPGNVMRALKETTKCLMSAARWLSMTGWTPSTLIATDTCMAEVPQ